MSKRGLGINLGGSLVVTMALVTSALELAFADTPGADSAAAVTSSALRAPMWSGEDLGRIIKADDLKVSPFREDGVTYGTPTWIWCVEVDGNLYVRAYHGKASSWYQAAVREKAGRIIAAGMTREVNFEGIEGALNDRIDQAYREKYGGSPYLADMISERARGATVKISPRVL